MGRHGHLAHGSGTGHGWGGVLAHQQGHGEVVAAALLLHGHTAARPTSTTPRGSWPEAEVVPVPEAARAAAEPVASTVTSLPGRSVVGA